MRFLPHSAPWVLALWLFTSLAQAAVLKYRIEGASAEARGNIQAYLGPAPKSAPAAERFLVTAQERAGDALQALGIYDFDVELSVDRAREPWGVVLRVRHGEALRYTGVRIDVLPPGDTDPALTAFLAERAPALGDRFHHGHYEEFKAGLASLARQRGYFKATFNSHQVELDAAGQTVALVMEFDPGERARFGPVLADDSLIDPGLLQRLLPFEAGAPYEQGRLLELRQRLLRLGYFASVIVTPDLKGLEAGVLPLQVSLVRAPSHSYEFGLGYSTDTRQRLSLTWQSPLLNSHGHSQETSLRWSPVNPTARMTYSIPLDDPANDILQFIARLEDNEFGDLDSLQRELGLRREQTRGQRIDSLSLRALNETWSVATAESEASFLLAGASLSRRSRRGDAVDPRGGLSEFYSVEAGAGALGSDEDLLRFYATATGLHRFAERWRVVSRLEAGILWTSSRRPDALPPSLAFFAGGDNSIRGFPYQSVGREVAIPGSPGAAERRLVVGGTRLLTGSLELQRYVFDDWRVALFADAGDAFDESEFDFNLGLGAGVHYLSPVGAIRLELAYPVTESDGSWRVHLNIGAEF